jgi:hypothetical protein
MKNCTEVLVGHQHEKASLVMILNWRGVSANGQFAHKEACKNREEISDVQRHDCQHATKRQLVYRVEKIGKLTAGNQVQPGGCKCKLSAGRY